MQGYIKQTKIRINRQSNTMACICGNRWSAPTPLHQRRARNKRQGNSAGSVLLKPAALPIVRSEGTGVARADAGGCFGVQGYLQKRPARLRDGTRIEHIAPAAHKTKPPELIQRFICRGNVGLRKLSPTYSTDFKYPRLHGLLRRR
jgi:hypothetical protein